MADGNDYNLLLLKDQGKPVEAVYASEGAPLIIVPSGLFRNAPNPNAARLFQSFFFSVQGQQLLVDTFAHRSFHAQIKEKPGRQPLSAIKLLKSDPAAVLAQSEEIKARSPSCSRCEQAPARGVSAQNVESRACYCDVGFYLRLFLHGLCAPVAQQSFTCEWLQVGGKRICGFFKPALM